VGTLGPRLWWCCRFGVWFFLFLVVFLVGHRGGPGEAPEESYPGGPDFFSRALLSLPSLQGLYGLPNQGMLCGDFRLAKHTSKTERPTPIGERGALRQESEKAAERRQNWGEQALLN